MSIDAIDCVQSIRNNDKKAIPFLKHLQTLSDDADTEDSSTSLDLSLFQKKSSLHSITSVIPLVHLRHLNVSNNSIKSLFGIHALYQLETLIIERNQLQKVEGDVAKLTRLKILNLCGNSIQTITKRLSDLTELHTLLLSGNSLKEFSQLDIVGRLSNLQVCSFLGNPFSSSPTYQEEIVSRLESIKVLDNQDIIARRNKAKLSRKLNVKKKSISREHAALISENARLKGELQVRTQLLQNKSKEWSIATNQLLQLQRELAMLNLDHPKTRDSCLQDLLSPRSAGKDQDEFESTSNFSFSDDSIPPYSFTSPLLSRRDSADGYKHDIEVNVGSKLEPLQRNLETLLCRENGIRADMALVTEKYLQRDVYQRCNTRSIVSFDEEIHLLTKQLQMVLVEKEETMLELGLSPFSESEARYTQSARDERHCGSEGSGSCAMMEAQSDACGVVKEGDEVGEYCSDKSAVPDSKQMIQPLVSNRLELNNLMSSEWLEEIKNELVERLYAQIQPVTVQCSPLEPKVPVAKSGSDLESQLVEKIPSTKSSVYAPSYDPIPAVLKRAEASLGSEREKKLYRLCQRLHDAQCEQRAEACIDIDMQGRKQSHLNILLMSARNLPTAHLRTKILDPFVLFQIVDSTDHSPERVIANAVRSSTRKKSLYPTWDEELTIKPIHSLDSSLLIRVMNDRKSNREQLIGEICIPLSSLLHQKRVTEWFPLEIPCLSQERPSETRNTAIRLQLCLSFSKALKIQRALDHAAGAYHRQMNHLPCFIRVNSPRTGEQDEAHGITSPATMTSLDPTPTTLSALCLPESHASSAESTLVSKDLTVGDTNPTNVETEQGKTPVNSDCATQSTEMKGCDVDPEVTSEAHFGSAEPSPVTSNQKESFADFEISLREIVNDSEARRRRNQVAEGLLRGGNLHDSLGNSIKVPDLDCVDRKRLDRLCDSPMWMEHSKCFDEYSPYHPRHGDSLHGMIFGGNAERILRQEKTFREGFLAETMENRNIYVTNALLADVKGKEISMPCRNLNIFKCRRSHPRKRMSMQAFPDGNYGFDNQMSERLKRAMHRTIS